METCDSKQIFFGYLDIHWKKGEIKMEEKDKINILCIIFVIVVSYYILMIIYYSGYNAGIQIQRYCLDNCTALRGHEPLYASNNGVIGCYCKKNIYSINHTLIPL